MAYLKLAAVFITITLAASFPFGYHLGVMNQPLERIAHFIGNVTVSRTGTVSDALITTITSLCVTAFTIGGMVGGLTGGLVSNKFGRRRALLFLSAPCLLGSVFLMICKLVNSFEFIIVGRLLLGLACGAYSAIGPIYLSEMAPPSIRGAAGVLNMLVTVSALMISEILGLPQILNTEELWPYLLGLNAIPCAISFVCLIFSPESPRYTFLIRKDFEKAKEVLTHLRPPGADIGGELQEMTMEGASAKQIYLLDLWRQPHLRLAMLVAIAAQIAQQFSGMIGLLYYSKDLFLASDLTPEQATYATIGVGATLVLVSCAGAFLIDRVGRRVLLIGGLILALFSLSSFTVFLAIKSYVNVQWLVYAALTSVFIFICGHGIGAGSIPWFIVAELFTQDSRDAASSIAISANWFCNILVGFGFIQMIKYIGIYSFVPFIAVSIGTVLFLFRYLPETKGQSAASIEAYFKERVYGARNSKHGAFIHDRSPIVRKMDDCSDEYVEDDENEYTHNSWLSPGSGPR